ncbi:SusC/RagA family TonB-linked outer membrane protein [Phocaeicola sartorii]|uniref:SusC/RagA family TonB-linked outer membrane protein n=2 Tax=Phocaeicola sartorii TaxID=671267 RepID=UPI001FD2C36E|nr:TonB-dependent receptor [Phocaeicola sartorii]
MKRKLMLLLTCLFVGIGLVTAQITKVTGTVISEEDGLPVVGASILVKGTTVGTVTDMDGKFTLSNVPSSAKTLLVSFIGMATQEVSIKANLQISLKSDTEVLDEVMVVAYGTAKKASFTGSASVMKAGEISTQKESLVKSLEGKVAGVRVGGSTGDPGSDQKILIRGIGSINGSTQPLYVVDGVPVVNDDMSSGLKSQSVLSSINPDDIASMTILKDAAAASLYGSRAANGVVIITTKQGKEGKTRVSYDMETGWTSMAVRNQYKMMDAKDTKDYYWHAIKNYFIEYAGMDEATAASAANEEVPGWFYNYNSDTNTDWKKEVYKNGLNTNHQVAINGGNEKTRFYTSFGYNKVKGIVKGSEFERYSGRLNLDHKVTNWLRVSAKQMISFSSTEGFRDQNDQSQGFGTTSPLSIMFSMDPTAPVKLEDGSYNPNASFSSKISNPNLMLGQKTGPRAETVASDLMRSMTNFEAEVTLPYNFTARTVLGYDYMNNKEREFWAPESVNGESLGGLGTRYDYTNKTLTSSTTLNYHNSFDRHNVNALVGYEVEDRSLNYLYASAKSYATDKLPDLANGQSYSTSSNVYEAAIMSYFGNINYDFDNKYYLSASFRRDGSSRLAADNRWANFWSVSGAWRLSGESFLQDNPLFTDLKLRVSYGTNGNLPGDYFGYMDTYSTNGGYGSSPAIYWGNAGNTKLGWEKSQNFNVGVDWNLYNRVNLTVEYYSKLTTDLLFQTPTSYVTGFSSQWQNLGKMKNQGVEFTISSQNVVTENFTWTTDLNLTRQSIKIKELPDGADVQYGDGNMYLLREGESMHTFYLPEYIGVNSETGLGEFWIDPDDHSKGVTNYYSKAGKGIVGKAVPDWMGGMTNRFTYKNFDLSFMISFQTGASLFDYPGYFLTYSDGVRVGSFNMTADVAGNYWTKPGDKVDNPKPIYNNPYRSDRFSSRTVRSTDNIRMRDITFGYKIPVSKKYINNLRVYFKATNPFLIYCATKDIDPDVDINGYRQTDTPPTKAFMFGLNFEL